jgi:hypothetical protein
MGQGVHEGGLQFVLSKRRESLTVVLSVTSLKTSILKTKSGHNMCSSITLTHSCSVCHSVYAYTEVIMCTIVAFDFTLFPTVGTCLPEDLFNVSMVD